MRRDTGITKVSGPLDIGFNSDPNAISANNETALSVDLYEGTMRCIKKLLSLGTMNISRGDLHHCSVQRGESTISIELIDRLIRGREAHIDAYESTTMLLAM